MKINHYIKLVIPIGLFGILFRLMEIIFAIEKDTNFYVRNSVIPTLFNIYCILATLFFLSAFIFIAKEKKASFPRLAKTGLPEKIFALAAATLILASSAKTFLFNMMVDKIYHTAADIFCSFDFYALLFGLIATFALIQFATFPKKSFKSNVDRLLLLALPIYFVLKLFKLFTNVESILNHAYTSFHIIYLAVTVLALINLIKLSVGVCARKFYVVFTLIAFFFTVMRIAELAVCLLNPGQIEIDVLDYGADLATSAFLLAMAFRVATKVERKQTDDTKFSETLPNRIEN